MTDSEGYFQLQEGLRLYYRIVGDGPRTVVIPGATGLAVDLESLARGRRVIFYDQRCRGQSDVDPDESHIWIDYEVHDLEAIRHHFGLERMSIIGWSYMGAISALYAATYPARVDRLVLMCAIPPRSDAPYNDSEARAKKENERIDPEGAKRLKEMQQQGLDTSDPETYCREFEIVMTPRQMGKPEALARRRSDQFLFAVKAWQMCRAGKADPNRFGFEDMRGLWFIRGNLILDLAAQNKMELLLWDSWGLMFRGMETPADDECNLLDKVAMLTQASNEAFPEMRMIYETEVGLKVPRVVKCYSPVSEPSEATLSATAA